MQISFGLLPQQQTYICHNYRGYEENNDTGRADDTFARRKVGVTKRAGSKSPLVLQIAVPRPDSITASHLPFRSLSGANPTESMTSHRNFLLYCVSISLSFVHSSPLFPERQDSNFCYGRRLAKWMMISIIAHPERSAGIPVFKNPCKLQLTLTPCL